MKYKPSEISKEIECNVDTIYKSYLPFGCPHERDEHGQIWIVGTEFRDWVKKTLVKRKEHRMGKDQAYCMKCRKVIDVPDLKTVMTRNARLEIVRGRCTECGTEVYRTRSRQ